MLIVALTGGIGSGKSHAGGYFQNLGAIVVDSDQLARDVIERGTPGFDEVINRFGDAILTEGDIDRRKLGEIVFEDAQARVDLESIIHPRIQATFSELVAQAPEGSIIINQIPLLVETGGMDRFDRIITVISTREKRVERLKARGMSNSEITRRMQSQVSDEERGIVSDTVIDNSGDADSLLRAIENLWELTLLPLARSKE